MSLPVSEASGTGSLPEAVREVIWSYVMGEATVGLRSLRVRVVYFMTCQVSMSLVSLPVHKVVQKDGVGYGWFINFV